MAIVEELGAEATVLGAHWTLKKIYAHLKSSGTIIVNDDKAKKYVIDIYRQALLKGGHIYATHYFPKTEDPLEVDYLDLIIKKEFKKSKSKGITFSRYVFLEDNKDIKNYAVKFFENKPEGLDLRLIYPVKGGSNERIFAINSLLNIGFLLLEGYAAYIGLDKFREIRNSKDKKAIGIYTKDKEVLQLLNQLWIDFIERANPNPITISSSAELEHYKNRILYNPKLDFAQSIANSIWCSCNDECLHISLFGSQANKIIMGPTLTDKDSDFENDFDFFIIINDSDSIDNVQDKIEKKLKNDFNNIHIEWGNDLRNFYPPKPKGKTSIEIELYPLGDKSFIDSEPNFYKFNYLNKSRRLLGYSIFSTFLPLLSGDGQKLKDLISIPETYSNEMERMNLTIYGDKGIRNMMEHINGIEDKSVDGKRIVSHLIRNYYWALSGNRNNDYEESKKYLLNKDPQAIELVNKSEKSGYDKNSVQNLIQYLDSSFTGKMDFKSTSYEGKNAQYYDKTFINFRNYALEADFLKQELKQNNINLDEANVLDIGCGSGNLAQQISSHINNIVGIDISKDMINIAERKNILKAKFIHTDALNFLWGYEKYELIYISYFLIQTLPSFLHLRRFIENSFQWLKPSGLLIFDFSDEELYWNKFKEGTANIDIKNSDWNCIVKANKSKLGQRKFEIKFSNNKNGIEIIKDALYLNLTSDKLKEFIAKIGYNIEIKSGNVVGLKEDYHKIAIVKKINNQD